MYMRTHTYCMTYNEYKKWSKNPPYRDKHTRVHIIFL